MLYQDELNYIDEIFDIYEFAMDTLNDCSAVLFRYTRRKSFDIDWNWLKSKLPNIRKTVKENIEDLEIAGLRGEALKNKVEWLREAKILFEKMGSVSFLKKLLEKLNIILKSIVGAIPGVGSGITELKDIGEKEIEDTEEHVPIF